MSSSSSEESESDAMPGISIGRVGVVAIGGDSVWVGEGRDDETRGEVVCGGVEEGWRWSC